MRAETNEAFLATVGEETALDVFVRSMTTDWIDQPAHTRRDELNDTKPHRPGILDNSQLRHLVERRFEILDTLQHAEAATRRAPVERQDARTILTRAEQRLADQTAALQHAETVLARYDRPLHRRKHQSDIGNARHLARILPGNIKHAAAEVDTQARRIADTRTTQAAAAAVVAQRPQLEQELGTIEPQLTIDLRVRTSIARLDQPDAIVNALGHRPAPGASTRTWDDAAGRLAQHQAAFNITEGFGGIPRWDRKSAYTQSYRTVEEAIAVVRPAPSRTVQIEPTGIEL